MPKSRVEMSFSQVFHNLNKNRYSLFFLQWCPYLHKLSNFKILFVWQAENFLLVFQNLQMKLVPVQLLLRFQNFHVLQSRLITINWCHVIHIFLKIKHLIC